MSEYRDPVFPAVFTGNEKELRPFDRDMVSALGEWSAGIRAILDRGISVDDNLDARIVSYTTHATPGTEDAIPHDLGKVPTGFVVTDNNTSGVIYRGSTAFTSSTVYLKCSASGAAVKILLF